MSSWLLINFRSIHQIFSVIVIYMQNGDFKEILGWTYTVVENLIKTVGSFALNDIAKTFSIEQTVTNES